MKYMQELTDLGKITRIAKDNKIDGYVLMGHLFWRKRILRSIY